MAADDGIGFPEVMARSRSSPRSRSSLTGSKGCLMVAAEGWRDPIMAGLVFIFDAGACSGRRCSSTRDWGARVTCEARLLSLLLGMDSALLRFCGAKMPFFLGNPSLGSLGTLKTQPAMGVFGLGS